MHLCVCLMFTAAGCPNGTFECYQNDYTNFECITDSALCSSSYCLGDHQLEPDCCESHTCLTAQSALKRSVWSVFKRINIYSCFTVCFVMVDSTVWSRMHRSFMVSMLQTAPQAASAATGASVWIRTTSVTDTTIVLIGRTRWTAEVGRWRASAMLVSQ